MSCRLCGHWTVIGQPFCRGRDIQCFYEARLRLGVPKGLAASWKRRDVERMRQAKRRAA